MLRKIPLGRFGRTEDVIPAINFILDNDFINGLEISIDGGISI